MTVIISQANEKTRPLLTGRGLMFVKVKQRLYNDAHGLKLSFL
jgi:hypothetical protein